MNCQDAQLLIMEFLDGELPQADKVRLDEHLAVCEACALELEAQRRLIEGVRSLPHMKAPDGFSADVRQAIEDDNRPRSRFPFFIARYGALAASIVIAMIGLTFYAKNQSSVGNKECDTCTIYDPKVIAEADAAGKQLKKQKLTDEQTVAVAEQKALSLPETAPVQEAVREKEIKANELELADRNAMAVNFDVTIQAPDVAAAQKQVVDVLQKQGAVVVAQVSAARSVIISAQIPKASERDLQAEDVKDAVGDKKQAVASRAELLRALASSFSTGRKSRTVEFAEASAKPGQMGALMAADAEQADSSGPVRIRIVPSAPERPMADTLQTEKK